MATIIDSLTVLLNLDPKGFTDNQKKAAESLRDFRRAGEENDKASSKRADAMDQEERRRQRERAEARAAEQRKNRDAAQGMERTQRDSAKRQAEAFTVAKEAALGFGAALATLGIGQRTDPRQFSSALADAGFSPEVTAFLLKGPAFDDAALASARERAPGDSEAAQDQQLANAASKLEQSFSRLDQVVVGNLAPWLTRSISRMTDFINLLTGHIDWSEFMRLRAVRKHEEEKQNYLLKGMSDAEAERRASMDDASGDWVKITQGAPQTLGVAPPGTTEEKGSEFWGWVGNAFGIHLYRKNKADPSASPASGGASGLPADIEAEIRKDAIKYGVDPDHMVRLFAAEGGGYNKVSQSGAFGPAQLLPGTAAQLGLPTSVNDPKYDWRKNVEGGVLYWLMQWQHFGKIPVADAAYHNGPNDPAVLRFWRGGDMSGFGPHASAYLKSIDGLLSAAPFSGGHDYSDTHHAPGGATNIASETNINSINVFTDSKSAAGIASNIRAEISKSPLVGKADKGTF